MASFKTHSTTVVVGVVTTVLATVVLAIMGFNKQNPPAATPEAPRIVVTQNVIEIPTDVGRLLEEKGIGSLKAEGWTEPKNPIPNTRLTTSDFYSGYLVQQFEITNDGEKIYNDVLVRFTDFESVAVSFRGKVEVSPTEQLTYSLSPGEKVLIWTVSDGSILPNYELYGGGKLLVAVGETPLPIKSLIRENSEKSKEQQIGEVVSPYVTLWGYAALLYILLSTFVFTVFVLSSIIGAIFPNSKFWVFDEQKLAGNLAMLEVYKERFPEQYAAIVKSAKKRKPALLDAAPAAEPADDE